MHFSAITLASALVASASAHTYLITPASRLSVKYDIGTSLASGSGNENGLCHLGDGTAVCCGAARMTGSNVKTYARGESVEAHSWRNNHVGGFSRWSIVPSSQADSQDAFDQNVFSMACNQVGCTNTYGGDSPNNWNGGDADGSSGWSNPCTNSFVIPSYLEDGAYTLQWVWFGQGNGDTANSPFQACLEINISGGDSVGAQPTCPAWTGGDTSEKSDVACSYVTVESPTYQGVCKSANACSGSYAVGVPKGLTACQAGNPPSTWELGMEETTAVSNTAGQVASNSSTIAATAKAAIKATSTKVSASTQTADSEDSGNDAAAATTTAYTSSSSSKSSSGKKCRVKNQSRRHLAARNRLTQHS